MSFPIHSLLVSVFQMRQQGQTTDEEFVLANASWVEQFVSSYPFHAIGDLPGAFVNYVDRRLSGQDFNADTAREMGKWFLRIFKVIDSNASNASLLLWAKAKMAEANLSAPRIDRALEFYSRTCFVPAYMARVLEVKSKDAELSSARKKKAS